MVSRNVPHEYFTLAVEKAEGPVVAHRHGKPIFATVIDRQGRRYRYIGVAVRDGGGRLEVLALRNGEWIVPPDLVYEEIEYR